MTEGTIEHASAVPTDDRPGYLSDASYVVAVDTETTGFVWEGEDLPFLATVSDYDRDWVYYLPLPEDTVTPSQAEDLRTILEEADVLIFHNASFDILMLAAYGIMEVDELLSKEIHDTDLLARVVNSREPNYRLKSLAQKYVDAEAADGEEAVRETMLSMGLIRKLNQRALPPRAYYDVWRASPSTLEYYAAKDTRITYDLFYALQEKATERDLKVYEMERALLPTIIRMEWRGVNLDADRTADLLGKHEVEYEDALKKLYEYNGGVEFDPNSREELIPFVESAGITLTQRTDNGGDLRVDKGVLSKYEDTHPEIATLLAYRQHEKFLTTYLRPMADRDVVHPSIMQIGAWTGRMSCRRPNFQNIPARSGPEIRSMIVPRDGYAFVVADYSSIELRLLAYYMNDEHLWAIIREGDPFVWLGEQIYGTKDQDEWPVKRQQLKNGFYAMSYGAGGPKLASTIGGGMTPEEGRALKKQMEASLGAPYRHLWSRIRKAVTTRGYVRTIAGRTQHVPKDKSYVGLNALIQGSAADVIKQATLNATRVLDRLGGYPSLIVHDELVCEVPSASAEKGLTLLVGAMGSAAHDLAPQGGLSLPAEGVICYNNYGEAK